MYDTKPLETLLWQSLAGMHKFYIPQWHKKTYFRASLCLFFLCSCSFSGSQAEHIATGTAPAQKNFVAQANLGNNIAYPAALSDNEVIACQANQQSKVEVTVIAQVKKVLPDDTHGLQHQKFLLILTNGTTVLVANDLTYGQRVPVEPGDVVKIHGEYVWNRLGGLIHWTHRSDEPRHESGWIELNGRIYQ